MLRHLGSLVGTPLGSLARVCEFACGHGRCTRMLVRDIAPERLWCSDIQADGVAFVQETFGVHGFVSRAEPELLDQRGGGGGHRAVQQRLIRSPAAGAPRVALQQRGELGVALGAGVDSLAVGDRVAWAEDENYAVHL